MRGTVAKACRLTAAMAHGEVSSSSAGWIGGLVLALDDPVWYISREHQRLGPSAPASSPDLKRQARCVPQIKFGKPAWTHGLSTVTTLRANPAPVQKVHISQAHP